MCSGMIKCPAKRQAGPGRLATPATSWLDVRLVVVSIVAAAALGGCGGAALSRTQPIGSDRPDPGVIGVRPPGGLVLDTNNHPLDGVTVTLFETDDRLGPLTQVAEGAAIMAPPNRQNPLVTNADGSFYWDVALGYYVITASKPGCVVPDWDGEIEARTLLTRVPPGELDQIIVLDCRPPDTVRPTLTITSRPEDLAGSSTATVYFDMSDDQPGVTATCGYDEGLYFSEIESPDLEACTSPYQITGLANGDHEVFVMVLDGHDNVAVASLKFTVDM
jgi:hypothetical protein